MTVTSEEGTASFKCQPIVVKDVDHEWREVPQDLLVLISRGLGLIRTLHGLLAMVMVGSMMSGSGSSTG